MRKRMPVWLIVVIVFGVLAVFGMVLNATGYESKSQLEQEQAAVAQPVEEPVPEPEPEETELKPSEESAAYRSISRYGEQAFPYGFDLHYLAGVKAERQMAENEWFFKILCDVTNEYGATAKDQTCDATLQRQGDQWTVVDFMVY